MKINVNRLNEIFLDQCKLSDVEKNMIESILNNLLVTGEINKLTKSLLKDYKLIK